jgi:glycosyltransferase involved in cell wall biosynthesis
MSFFFCIFATNFMCTIMKIIQIGSYPISPDCIHGGVEASVYGLVQELAKNHILDVFDIPRIGEMDRVERFGNLTIHRYANPGTHNKDAVLRLSEIVRDIVALCPEVCHIHGTGAISKELYFALRHHSLPVMVTVHGLLREEKKQALLRKPSLKTLYQYIVQSRDERTMLNATPRVIVDTAYVEDMLQHYGLKQVPEMHVIPQGIDETFYSISCNPKSNMILCVGAIAPRKGHIYTVEMFNLLRAKGIDAQLRIIGSLAYKAYYELLQQKIAASPYASDISLEANLPREELLKAYSEAKLFVLHSREESQGIVFAEAMATGLPVVATKIGGIPYVVADGKSGLLCPYADVDAMTEMVAKLMKDNELWKQYSAAACEISRGYSWTDIAEQITNVYKRM